MKNLAIYFSEPGPMDYPFNVGYPNYWKIYQDIIRDVEKNNIGVYIVRGLKSYEGEGIFSHGWQVKNGELITINEKIRVDLIFHRGSQETVLATSDCPVINHPDLERFTDDKIKVANFFSDISPKTKAINSYKEFQEIIHEWKVDLEEKIVIKKNFLYGGHGVHILPLQEVVESLYEDWQDILVQEFIDSSVGISGIVEGLHDIRITSINGEPVFTYVRIPASGSFLANLAQGGKVITVSLDMLPSSLLEKVSLINTQLAQYKPSIIAADFVNSKHGFKLVEINSRPGVRDPDFSLEDKKVHDKTVQMLVDALA